ncbi:MAG: hypothetical protein QM714_00645 [Nocardioides sp.]|uniref:hypothetical protein n=1 Tax=Nocardioides sp. TaxID=35761 RepID=UPI0039E387D8
MSGQHRGPMVAFMVVALVCAGLLFHESRGRAGTDLLHPSRVPAAAASEHSGRLPAARSTAAAELEVTSPSRPATAPPTTLPTTVPPSQTQGTSIPGSPRAKPPGVPAAGQQRDQTGESNHTMQAKKADGHRRHRRARAQPWQPPGADPAITPPSEPTPPAP